MTSASRRRSALPSIDAEIAELKKKLEGLEAEWATEQKLVGEIRSLRDILNPPQWRRRRAISRPPTLQRPRRHRRRRGRRLQPNGARS